MKKLFRILLTLCMTLALCPATALAEGSDGGVVNLLWQDGDEIYSGTDRSSGTRLTKGSNYCELNAGSYKLYGNIFFSGGNEAFKFSGDVEVNLDSKQVSSVGRMSFFVDNDNSGGLLKLTGGGTVSSEKSDDFSYGCYGNITGHQIVIDGITVEGGTIGICNGVSFGSYRGGDYVTMKSGSIEDCNVGIWVPEKLTLGGGTIGTKEKPLPTAILLSGTMNADGGTVYGTVKSRGKIERSSGATGTTAFHGTVENGEDLGDGNEAYSGIISAGEYFGAVNNNVVEKGDQLFESTISGGTFHGTVNNNSSSNGSEQATISGGEFVSKGTFVSIVNNSGAITGGAFKGTVTNKASGKIEGGTFSGKVTNEASGTISNGTFKGEVTNSGTITGGTFSGKVTNNGSITGGAFYGGIDASGSGSVSGTKHAVTFDLNGGAVAGTAPADQVFVGTSTAMAQEPSAKPTKEGYTFSGWYTDSACEQEYDFNSSVTEDITLYAGFQPIPCDITYNYGLPEGVAAPKNPTTYTIETPDFTLTAPTWDMHSFLGWTYDGQATPVVEVTIPKGSMGSREYTAHWAELYAVSFDPNGGVLDAASSVAYTTAEGALALSKLPEPTRDGCKFAGWFTGKDGGSKVTLSTTFTQNATLYAHWEDAPTALTDGADGSSGTAIAKTGDGSHAALWLAVLAASSAVVLPLAVRARRGRASGRR